MAGCRGVPVRRAGRAPRARTAVLSLSLCLSLCPAPAQADPGTDYLLHCRGCHGPDGVGAPGGAPVLRGHMAQFLSVPNGREYLVRVPGSAQSELSDERLAALLTWALGEFDAAHLPAAFVPYGADEVGRLRRQPLVNVDAVRRDLVRALAARGAPPPRGE